MTKDLPDFQSEVVSAAVEATALRSGLDADKPASPAAGDIWLARDTFYLYVCFVAGSWEKVAKLYLPLAGGIMTGAIAMGTNSITGLPAPTGTGHAVRKSYADGLLALVLLLTGGTMSGAIAMGSNKITGLAAPTAAADAARKTDVDTVNAKLNDVSVAEPARAIGTTYQNTSGKTRVAVITVWRSGLEWAYVYMDTGSTPTTEVGRIGGTDAGSTEYNSFTFIIPPNYYYRLVNGAGTPTLQEWWEFDLM